MAVLQEQEAKNWIGRDLDDSDGERMGKVDGLYFDETTGRPEWLLVKTGLFGDQRTLVPAALLTRSGDHLVASFNKEHLVQALRVGEDETPTEVQQRFLHRYWGLEYKPLGTRF